jgi:DNA-binding PadR family transcriptional regulator
MTRLVILGLLLQKPMHGYEIQTMIETSKMDQWANILSGSIYYALTKMEQEELIQTVAEERSGARLRKIYGITEKGKQEFLYLLRKNLQTPPHSLQSDFALSLNWISHIPAAEAIVMMKNAIETLEKRKEQWKYGKEQKLQHGLHPIMAAGFDNALEIMEADIRYLKRVIHLLQAETE